MPAPALAGDLADVGGQRVVGGDVRQALLAAHAARRHVAVDEALVHQQVDVLRGADQPVAHRGVARERDARLCGLEQEAEGGLDRPVVDLERADPQASASKITPSSNSVISSSRPAVEGRHSQAMRSSRSLRQTSMVASAKARVPAGPKIRCGRSRP